MEEMERNVCDSSQVADLETWLVQGIQREKKIPECDHFYNWELRCLEDIPVKTSVKEQNIGA